MVTVPDPVPCVGVLFELTGIALALVGLRQLKRDLFGQPLPYERGWQWITSALGFKRPARVVRLEGAVEIGVAGKVRALVTKRRPSLAASLADWNAYWDSRLENLLSQIWWLEEDMKTTNEDLAAKIAAESRARTAAVAEIEEHLKSAVGGRDGTGLDKAWWGLALTFVGVLFQAFG